MIYSVSQVMPGADDLAGLECQSATGIDVAFAIFLAGVEVAIAAAILDLLLANLCLFRPDGSGSAASMCPKWVNGSWTTGLDPYCNDQDWALVHYRMLQRSFSLLMTVTQPRLLSQKYWHAQIASLLFGRREASAQYFPIFPENCKSKVL